MLYFRFFVLEYPCVVCKIINYPQKIPIIHVPNTFMLLNFLFKKVIMQLTLIFQNFCFFLYTLYHHGIWIYVLMFNILTTWSVCDLTVIKELIDILYTVLFGFLLINDLHSTAVTCCSGVFGFCTYTCHLIRITQLCLLINIL